MEKISVVINNWRKFNPRKDLKRPTWFALSNDFLDDPSLSDFAPLEFHALIYIFCQASKMNSENVDIFFAHASKFGISEKLLVKTIEKLQSKGILAGSVQIRTESERIRTDLCTTLHNTTDITIHNTTPEMVFDFEESAKPYPRREGIGLGIKRLKARIKTLEDFNKFKTAVSNYAKKCRLDRTEEKYIKHFSSFVGTDESEPWRDFVDYKPAGQNTHPPPYHEVLPPKVISDPDVAAKGIAELKKLFLKTGTGGA